MQEAVLQVHPPHVRSRCEHTEEIVHGTVLDRRVHEHGIKGVLGARPVMHHTILVPFDNQMGRAHPEIRRARPSLVPMDFPQIRQTVQFDGRSLAVLREGWIVRQNHDGGPLSKRQLYPIEPLRNHFRAESH